MAKFMESTVKPALERLCFCNTCILKISLDAIRFQRASYADVSLLMLLLSDAGISIDADDSAISVPQQEDAACV